MKTHRGDAEDAEKGKKGSTPNFRSPRPVLGNENGCEAFLKGTPLFF